MPDTPIPHEAVEAAAEALRTFEPSEYEDAPRMKRDWRERAAKRALAAALPFPPQHVSPSVEALADLLKVHDITPDGSILDGDLCIVCSCGEVFSGWHAADTHRAQAVLALFSSTPTVEQVRRETRLADADWCDSHHQRGLARTLRARAAEAVDPRGE